MIKIVSTFKENSSVFFYNINYCPLDSLGVNNSPLEAFFIQYCFNNWIKKIAFNILKYEKPLYVVKTFIIVTRISFV